MKRKIGILMVAASLLLLIGCSAKPNNANNTAQSRVPGNGRQGQFVRADLYGEITSVSSNKTTLKLIATPAFSRNTNNGGQGGQRTEGAENGQTQQRPQGSANRQNRSIQYTGETKTITIPDNVPITTVVRGQNGREEQIIQLEDIKSGDILQIWYSDKEKEIISRIVLNRPLNSGD